MVQVIVEIDATPRRALMIVSSALQERNKVLARAVPDASVNFDIVGVVPDAGPDGVWCPTCQDWYPSDSVHALGIGTGR